MRTLTPDQTAGLDELIAREIAWDAARNAAIDVLIRLQGEVVYQARIIARKRGYEWMGERAVSHYLADIVAKAIQRDYAAIIAQAREDAAMIAYLRPRNIPEPPPPAPAPDEPTNHPPAPAPPPAGDDGFSWMNAAVKQQDAQRVAETPCPPPEKIAAVAPTGP